MSPYNGESEVSLPGTMLKLRTPIAFFTKGVFDEGA